jgi:hypothetical protein
VECIDPLFKVNDTEIKSLVDVPRVIGEARLAAQGNPEAMVTFEFCSKFRIVLPLIEGFVASGSIQTDFGIPALVSKDIGTALAANGWPILEASPPAVAATVAAAAAAGGSASASVAVRP